MKYMYLIKLLLILFVNRWLQVLIIKYVHF